jgi:hypothetical protein
MAPREADIQLAMPAVDTQQIRSSRSTATICNVDQRTFRRRRAGVIARRDTSLTQKTYPDGRGGDRSTYTRPRST